MNADAHDLGEPLSRRDWLLRGGTGFGALALSGLLAKDNALSQAKEPSFLRPHFVPRAKRVIFLFMEGGPSQMDLFDPKPLLNKLAGQRLPQRFKRPITAMGEAGTRQTAQAQRQNDNSTQEIHRRKNKAPEIITRTFSNLAKRLAKRQTRAITRLGPPVPP